MSAFSVLLLLISLALLNVGNTKTINITQIGSRIVGGTNATRFQFPYYTQIVSAIKLNETKTGHGNCGGSVISSTFVLTAAHCVKNSISNKVIMGFYTVDDLRGAIAYSVKSIRIHEEYNSTARTKDIALIELNKEITFTDFIKPIQFSCNYTEPDVPTVVAGTGLTSDAERKSSSSLQWTNLTTISNEQCTKIFGPIETSNLCAVGKQKYGSCQGDSGTALIREVNDTQIQIGVLSWGVINGCERGYPSVYTRLSDNIDWIKLHTNVSCVNE